MARAALLLLHVLARILQARIFSWSFAQTKLCRQLLGNFATTIDEQHTHLAHFLLAPLWFISIPYLVYPNIDNRVSTAFRGYAFSRGYAFEGLIYRLSWVVLGFIWAATLGIGGTYAYGVAAHGLPNQSPALYVCYAAAALEPVVALAFG